MKQIQEIYLDNASTTRVIEPVMATMQEVNTHCYGNPSSMHMKGITAENYIKEAKKQIAHTLNAQPNEIYFTSGGTESDNLAIIGGALAYRRKGMHIITTPFEHPAVSSAMEVLKEQGFRVTTIPVDQNGIVSPKDVVEAICEDTIMVAIMYVNNEIGAIAPIEEIGQQIKKRKEDILFVVDAVQAYGHLDIKVNRQKIDCLTISAHKIHGPKGVGAIYIRKGVRLIPLMVGGGQQNGIRPGTENVPGIAGIGEASKAIFDDFDKIALHLSEIKTYFLEEVAKIPESVCHSLLATSADHIASVSFSGIRSEVLLHALEDKGIYVSSGSACSTNKPGLSATLQAIKLPKEMIESTLRFSFSRFTTKEEIDVTIEQLLQLTTQLRKYTRR